MPRLKKQLLTGDNDSKKTYTLTDSEFNYLKDMNTALAFHTLRGQLISGFLTHVCVTRLGYETIREGYYLKYEVDPTNNDHTLSVEEVPKPTTLID